MHIYPLRYGSYRGAESPAMTYIVTKDVIGSKIPAGRVVNFVECRALVFKQAHEPE